MGAGCWGCCGHPMSRHFPYLPTAPSPCLFDGEGWGGVLNLPVFQLETARRFSEDRAVEDLFVLLNGRLIRPT
jgi:hypothetical protein